VPNPTFSENLRQACVGRLLACLADLSGQTTVVKFGEKSSKVAAVASDGEFWVAKVIDTIQALEKDTKHVSLLTQSEEEEISLRKKALQLADRLKDVCESFFLKKCALLMSFRWQVSGEMQEAAKGARLLLLATVLHQYCSSGQDEEMHGDALEVGVSVRYINMFILRLAGMH